MSKQDWFRAILVILALAGTLAAQPDPTDACLTRVSAAVNVPVDGTGVLKTGGLENGNYVIWWIAKPAGSHKVNGFCEVNPLNGRVVRLETGRMDSKTDIRPYRITPDDAERVCQTAARERFSPGNALLEARAMPNTSSKSTYRVAWQYNVLDRPIRRGRCEIDSATGAVLKVHSDVSWWR